MSGLADLRVSRTTVDVLRQHRDALETLRTAFNALEAKQRQQAKTLIALADRSEQISDREDEDYNRIVRNQRDFLALPFWQRMRWLILGY